MLNKFLFTIAFILLVLVSIKLFSYLKKSSSAKFPEKTKLFYINLDKNDIRKDQLLNSYNDTDMKNILLTRFPAILGKKVELKKWLTPDALIQIKETEETNTRTHHYQLTRGAVGCFLSHYTLCKQLTEDPDADYYLIFEDDIIFNRNLSRNLNNYLSLAPSDWDIIQLYTHRKTAEFKTVGQFYKPQGFWGTQGYIINKKGAQKLVNEVVKNKIDGQIDAYLSRMIQQDKINLYITKQRLVGLNLNIRDTDIQCKIARKNINDNPFNYKGYLV